MTHEARKPAAFPWDEAMAFGFCVLRLAPAAFWSMTPRELAAAMRGMKRDGSAAPGRPDLERMLHIFPDKTNDRSDHG